MKKFCLVVSILVFAILAACSISTSDSKSTAPSESDGPSTTTNTTTQKNSTMKDVCSGNYSCYYGCQGVNIFECKSNNKFYANEKGSYTEVDVEPTLGKYIEICGDGEACSEPNYTATSTNTSGGSSGGTSICSQLGCGGIFCSGKCVGCPGC